MVGIEVVTDFGLRQEGLRAIEELAVLSCLDIVVTQVEGRYEVVVLVGYAIVVVGVDVQFEAVLAIGDRDTASTARILEISGAGDGIEAEEVAQSLDGVDTDDGTDLSIVVGAWGRNHLHRLDVVRRELL